MRLSSMHEERMPNSYCADAQSDPSLGCPLPDSSHTIEYINEEQQTGCDLAHALDDVIPHILRMLRHFLASKTWPKYHYRVKLYILSEFRVI